MSNYEATKALAEKLRADYLREYQALREKYEALLHAIVVFEKGGSESASDDAISGENGNLIEMVLGDEGHEAVEAPQPYQPQSSITSDLRAEILAVKGDFDIGGVRDALSFHAGSKQVSNMVRRLADKGLVLLVEEGKRGSSNTYRVAAANKKLAKKGKMRQMRKPAQRTLIKE